MKENINKMMSYADIINKVMKLFKVKPYFKNSSLQMCIFVIH